MNCQAIDELAAAYGLGALSADEERDVTEHLQTCAEAHAEARELVSVALALPIGLDPVTPSAGLRERLMATIERTPQDHVAAEPRAAASEPIAPVDSAPRRRWWQLAPAPAGLAAVALAAAVGLGAWNVSLNQQLGDREAALRAVANADVAYAARGSAGTGWVIESGERAFFIADSLVDLPAGHLYELWLIDPDGESVAVGTLTDTDGIAMVDLEHELGEAMSFALTVETERVETPTSEPVLVATLGG